MLARAQSVVPLKEAMTESHACPFPAITCWDVWAFVNSSSFWRLLVKSLKDNKAEGAKYDDLLKYV